MTQVITTPQQGSIADRFRALGDTMFDDGLTPYQRQMMALQRVKSSRIEGAHKLADDALRRGDTLEYIYQSARADRPAADMASYIRAQAANTYGPDDARTTNAAVGAGDPYGGTSQGFRETLANQRAMAARRPPAAYTPPTPVAPLGDDAF
jgi:hypothetical protein